MIKKLHFYPPKPLLKSTHHGPVVVSSAPLPLNIQGVISELKKSYPRLTSVQFASTTSSSPGFASSSGISLNPSLLSQNVGAQQFIILHEMGHIKYNDPQEGFDYEKRLGIHSTNHKKLSRLFRLQEVSADVYALSKGPEFCQGCRLFTDELTQREGWRATQASGTHHATVIRKLIAENFLKLYQSGLLKALE